MRPSYRQITVAKFPLCVAMRGEVRIVFDNFASMWNYDAKYSEKTFTRVHSLKHLPASALSNMRIRVPISEYCENDVRIAQHWVRAVMAVMLPISQRCPGTRNVFLPIITNNNATGLLLSRFYTFHPRDNFQGVASPSCYTPVITFASAIFSKLLHYIFVNTFELHSNVKI